MWRSTLAAAILFGGNDAIAVAAQLRLERSGLVVHRIHGAGRSSAASSITVDVQDQAACKDAVARIEEEAGRVTALVTIVDDEPALPGSDSTDGDWDVSWLSAVAACTHLAHAVWEPMVAGGFGRIVTVGSVVGQTGHADYLTGSAAMAALRGLTKSLAKKGGPHGITANLIAAGAIIPNETTETGGVLGALAAAVLVGRCGRPEDVARAIAFLCDSDAGYITGSTLSVNGGSFMH